MFIVKNSESEIVYTHYTIGGIIDWFMNDLIDLATDNKELRQIVTGLSDILLNDTISFSIGGVKFELSYLPENKLLIVDATSKPHVKIVDKDSVDIAVAPTKLVPVTADRGFKVLIEDGENGYAVYEGYKLTLGGNM